MLVYSTRVWLNGGFDTAWRITAEWIAYKFKCDPTALGFETDGSYRSGRMEAHWTVERGGDDHLAACRLSHPDSKTNGRKWVVDIGVRSKNGEPQECSVTQRAEDSSTMVGSRPETQRPYIVKQWIEHGKPVERTPGRQIHTLTAGNARRFLDWIETRQRQHPILVVSPQLNGELILPINQLWFYLAGLADVVHITPEDAQKVKDIVGERYIPWNGAARIINPAFRSPHNDKWFITVERIHSDDLMLMAAQEDQQQGRDLLEMIAHGVNARNAREQLSLEDVRDYRLHRKIRQHQLDQEAAEALLESASQAERQIRDLEAELAERDQRIEELQDSLRRANEQNESLQMSLDFKRAGKTEVDSKLLELRPAFINAVEDDATPEEILRLIAAFFPDRVVVLDSAFRSAQKVAQFGRPEAAFKLILKLVTLYYDRLIEGKGDAYAREVFGRDEYSANESETVIHNRRARDARTFNYKGESLFMPRHLKLGVKDSITDTLRVHFHWDADDKKLVIGHCGEHLYLPSF